MSVPTLYHEDREEWLDLGLNAGDDGGALYTAGNGQSTWQLTIGAIDIDASFFRFPGMHGSFREGHGAVGRAIIWRGNLRVAAGSLAGIQAQRDNWMLSDGPLTFFDEDDVQYGPCCLKRFEIDKLNWRPIVGEVINCWVPYEIELMVLEP